MNYCRKANSTFGKNWPTEGFYLSATLWRLTRTLTIKGTLPWPSGQSFHRRHWAVIITDSVRQDTIEYWQNKFEIRMRIYIVKKAWNFPICLCGSSTIYFVQNIILTVYFRLLFGFISWNTDSRTFTFHLLSMSAIINATLKRWLCDKSGRSYPFYSSGPCLIASRQKKKQNNIAHWWQPFCQRSQTTVTDTSTRTLRQNFVLALHEQTALHLRCKFLGTFFPRRLE